MFLFAKRHGISMRVSEKIASFLGISLTVLATILLWWISFPLGLVFTIFVLAVIIWYLNTRNKGNLYLREVAKLIKCEFASGGLAYGEVTGSYKGRRIEIRVNKGYDSLRGFAGFILSSIALESAIGVLAGIRSFTSVKIEHRAIVEEPFMLDDRTIVDRHLVLYLPPCHGISGIPVLSPESLVDEIDGILGKIRGIEV